MSSRVQDQVMSVEKIGRYEIVGELGKGAMGVVYKAKDPNIGRVVALKTMRLDIHGAEHDAMVKRFQNEARAAGLLNHPNIVTIYDAGEADGIFYIAMEYIEGQTLASLLFANRTLPAPDVVDIGNQICSGLQYAHFRKVIHRDIKPANIMISANGGPVKIMDFGIAKAGGSLTHPGEVVGTPHYMSPEQVRGQDLDGRSDLFSTGVLLYEMITGEKPFNGESVTTIIYKIVNENPIPPRELDVTIHPGLSQVIVKCLSKDPDARYQEADDLGTALRSYKFVAAPEARTFIGTLPIGFNGTATANVPRPPAPKPMPSTPPPIVPNQAVPAARTAAAVRTATSLANTSTFKPLVVSETAPPAPQKSGDPRQALLLFAVLAIVLVSCGVLVWTLKHQTSLRPAATVQAQPAYNNSEQQPPPDVVDSSRKSARPPVQPKGDPVAATTAPVVEGLGSMRVTSNPAGAQVTIDGVSQEWYVTPFNTAPLKSGMHTVTASASGFPPQTKQVEILADKKISADFQLLGDNAIYNIASMPSGAEISIDGTPTGSRTPAQFPLKAGTHHVILRLEGFHPADLMTSSAPGESVTVAPRMQALNSVDISGPVTEETQSVGTFSKVRRFLGGSDVPVGKGVVQIKTRPKGALVAVAGFNIARPTPLRIPIRPGSYTITIQKPGFQLLTRTVQVEEGKVLELDEILAPKEQ
jgi:serine/threonine-protein kinase